MRHLVGMGLRVWWDGSRRQLPPAAQAELKEAASEGEVMPDWAANSSSQAGENSLGSVCLITEGGGQQVASVQSIDKLAAAFKRF